MLLLGIALLAYSPRALAAEGTPRVLGTVVARRGDQQLGTVNVIAPQDVESTSWLRGWF